jgi:hypothetical protein
MNKSNRTEYWRNKANALAKELKASKRLRIDFLHTVEAFSWSIQYHAAQMDFGSAKLAANMLEQKAHDEAGRLGVKEDVR